MSDLITRKLEVDPATHDATVESRIQILEKIASTLNVEEVLKRIVEAAVDLSGADEGSLLLIDEKTGELYMRAAKGFGEYYASTFRQPVSNDTVAGRVIITGRPVLITPEAPSPEQIKIKTDHFAHSVLNLPIKQGSIVYGVLAVYNSGNRAPFTQEHLSLLAPLANYAAIAIENAHRYQETSELLGDNYTLFDIAGFFTETRDMDELLDLIAAVALGRVEPADRIVIHLFDPETGRLEYKVRMPAQEDGLKTVSSFAVDEGVAGRVLKENRPINIPNVKDEASFISRGLTFGSLLVVPISWRSSCVGTISVASLKENAFQRRNERFLTSLANFAAIAIENARLYARQMQLYEESQERLETVERRNRELSSLRDVLGAMQSTLALPEVLARIAHGVIKGLNYRAVMLSIVDEVNSQLIVKEFALDPEFARPDLIQQAKRLAHLQLLENSASLENHTTNIGVQVCLDGQARITRRLRDIFTPIIDDTKSWAIQQLFQLETFAVLPIRSEQRLFGVLCAGTPLTEISEEHLEALQAFANQAALAIQNARQFEYMHERLRRRMKELQSLQDIDRLISSNADLEMMLQNILEVGLKLVNAEYGDIALADKEAGQLAPQVSHPQGIVAAERYGLGLSAWVAQAHKTARIPDLARTGWANVYSGVELRAALAAPILVGEELVGVINMASPTVDAFTEEDESLLDILATQTAVAIQTARSYQELERTRQRSYEAERIAAMSDMASNMVHNINNSIGAIRVLVQQIRFKLGHNSLTPEFLTKKLEGIERSAEQTLEMARSIRNPFQNLATEAIDVNVCLQSALKKLEPVPSTLEVNWDLDRDLPPVKATQQLEEVFRNLINNAIQSMHGYGQLGLATHKTEKGIEIAVTDSGPGLARDLSATSVFNLGVSTKRDGLGYGLWWCKIYLNRVGGAIELDTTYKAGCRFIVKIPLEPLRR